MQGTYLMDRNFNVARLQIRWPTRERLKSALHLSHSYTQNMLGAISCYWVGLYEGQ